LGSVPNNVSHYASCDVLIVQTTSRTVDDLEKGEGAIVLIEGRRAAVFKDEAGQVHAVSPRCTHLGCRVGWNARDRTWDCPCHGSRYKFSGEVIQGPAENNLERI
jgi:Rieske Fe-S protein